MKTFSTILLTLLLPIFAQAQAQAQVQSRSPVWAAYTPFTDTLGTCDVEVTNANTAWFLTVNLDKKAQVARTTDGGATFNVSDLPLQGTATPFTPCMTSADESTAFVMALQNWGNAVTLKTTDGGQTWQNTYTPWDPGVSYPDYIHAFSPTKICQIGDPRNGEYEIYNTLDDGLSWARVDTTNIPAPLPGEYGYNNSGDVVGSHIWFGTNMGRLYHSSDYGYTWEVAPTPLNGVGGLAFSDENNGIVAGVYGLEDSVTTRLFRTTDGGANWSEITLPISEVYHYYGVPAYIKGTATIVAGVYTNPQPNGKNQTWVSKDRGDTWTPVSDGEMIGWPTYYSSTIGWAGEWGPFTPSIHSTRVFKYIGDPLVGLFSPKQLDAEVTLSPNPASDVLRVNVQAQEAGDFWIMLNDTQGKLIKKETSSGISEFEKTLEIKNLPAGTYTLTVSSAKGSLMRKFVKQ